jgi:transcriptional regulator with PAS, ATPase and Fis domain
MAARRRRPFIRINCAAIPESLVESELFGYKGGAFTGADAARQGLLADGAGDTVFFDEIGDMSPLAQAKVLRVIESKEMRRLGGRGTILIDVRLLPATNRNLEQLVSCGTFRSDLYYRLNVARIDVSPLREHTEDIPVLAQHQGGADELQYRGPRDEARPRDRRTQADTGARGSAGRRCRRHPWTELQHHNEFRREESS